MKNKVEILANIVSNVFNAYLGLLLSITLVVLLEKDRINNPYLIILLSVFLITANILILKKFKLISDWEISNKDERPKFALSVMIPYLLMLYLALNNQSDLFTSLVFVIILLNILIGIISIFWKISGHMIYISLLAFVSLYQFKNPFLLIFWLILIPTVAWSRVNLQRHTIAQVIVGALLGLFLPLIFL